MNMNPNGKSHLTADQWVGFATRTVPLHWRKGVGWLCAILSFFPIMIEVISSDGVLSYKRTNGDVITIVIGIALLLVGLLMIMFDALRQRREIERGEINATGVFWNPTTKEKLEGMFHFNIDSGSMMFDKPQTDNKKSIPIPSVIMGSFCFICGLAFITTGIWACLKGQKGGHIGIITGLFFAAFPFFMTLLIKKTLKIKSIGFKHKCYKVQHSPNQTSTTPKPLLKMVFTVKGGMTKGEFGGSTFKSNTDMDTIVFLKGFITRIKGANANPCWLCSEVGTQLQHEVPDMIDVQVAVNRDLQNAITTQSSNAGVIGAGLGGIVGGVIGASISKNREKQRQQEFGDHLAKNKKLYEELQRTAKQFGWRVYME